MNSSYLFIQVSSLKRRVEYSLNQRALRSNPSNVWQVKNLVFAGLSTNKFKALMMLYPGNHYQQI